MLDSTVVGATDKDVVVYIEANQLAGYADAIGETNPIYRSRNAAVSSGYPNIPIPLTYYFSLALLRERPLGFLVDRQVDLLKILHGEQSFHYKRLIFAGETLTVTRRVVDFYERKSGDLQFVVLETSIRDTAGELVVTANETLVLPRQPAIRQSAADAHAFASGPAEPGDLPQLRPGHVSEAILSRFAQASGDRNPIHVDRVAARSAGYDTVFAHGMLSMAWVGRMLSDWTRQENVRSFAVRFTQPLPLHATPVCSGRLREQQNSDGIQTIDLCIRLETGATTLTGTANVMRA